MILWAILFYFAGLLLVFAEFFVPGGICGFFGVLAVIISCVIACIAFPDMSLFIVIAEFLGIILGIILGFKYLPRTKIGKSIILENSQQPDMGYVAAYGDESLVGQVAEVFTPMRPAGTIVLGGKKYDAVASGTHIEKGAKVKIIEVKGSRIVVEQVE